MIQVWGRNSSVNVQKVMWALAELGLPAERTDAGGAFGGLDTPEYLARNPNARVPTLQDGDLVLWESNAVVRYLALRYGRGSLGPSDPAAWATADMWMDWQQTTLIPTLTVAFWGLIRTPEEKRDMAAIRRAAEDLGSLWRRLDEHLADRRFVAGDELTMGDIPVGSCAWRWYELPIERPRLEHVEAWYARLKERPAYREHVMLPLT